MKSRKAIDGLFKGGKSFFIHPYKVFYNVLIDSGGQMVDDSLDKAESCESLINNELLTNNSKLPPTTNHQPSTIQAGFAVSTRNFKHAVDRNRIKRLGREAYRLNKQLLIPNFEKQGVKLQVFFVFTNKTLPTFVNIQAAMQACMRKLVKYIQSPKK